MMNSTEAILPHNNIINNVKEDKDDKDGKDGVVLSKDCIVRYFPSIDRKIDKEIDHVVFKFERLLSIAKDINSELETSLRKRLRACVMELEQLGPWSACQLLISTLSGLPRCKAQRSKDGTSSPLLSSMISSSAKVLFKFVRSALGILQEAYFPHVASNVCDGNSSEPMIASSDVESSLLVRYHIPVQPTQQEHLSNQVWELLSLLHELELDCNAKSSLDVTSNDCNGMVHQEENGLSNVVIVVERRPMAVLLARIINVALGPSISDNLRKSEGAPLSDSSQSFATWAVPLVIESEAEGILERFNSKSIKILVVLASSKLPDARIRIHFCPCKRLSSLLIVNDIEIYMRPRSIVLVEYKSDVECVDIQATAVVPAKEFRVVEGYLQSDGTVANTKPLTKFKDKLPMRLAGLWSFADSEYSVSSTKVKVNLMSALSFLQKFSHDVSDSRYYSSVDPVYDAQNIGGGLFVCRVELPPNAYVCQATSSVQPSLLLAKQSIAMFLVHRLHTKKALDDQLCCKTRLPTSVQSVSLTKSLPQNVRGYEAKLVAWPASELEHKPEGVVFYGYALSSSMDPSLNMLLLSVIEIEDEYQVHYTQELLVHWMRLDFVGKKLFARDEVRLLQQYYCVLLSALLPSTFTEQLLAHKKTFSPMILAPARGISEDLRAFFAPSKIELNGEINAPYFFNSIDWDYVRLIESKIILGPMAWSVQQFVESSGCSIAQLNTYLERQLLLSAIPRPDGSGFNYRRMRSTAVLNNIKPDCIALKRIFKSSVASNHIKPSDKVNNILTDVLRNRHRPIEWYNSGIVVVTTTVSSVRGIRPVVNSRFDAYHVNTLSEVQEDEEESMVVTRVDTNAPGGLQPTDIEYILQSSQRLENVPDFIVPIGHLLIHPIGLDRVKPLLGVSLLLHSVEHKLVAEACRTAIVPKMKSTSLLLAAISAPGAQLENNYERLETLGDCVLKLLVSMHVMAQWPSHQEGQLTARKTSLIRNSYLFKCAEDLNIAQYIITDPFFGRKFLPLGIDDLPSLKQTVEDVRSLSPPVSIKSESTKTVVARTSRLRPRTISDKTVADVIEAIIGAYFLDQDCRLEPVWTDLLSGKLGIVPAELPYPRAGYSPPRRYPAPALASDIHHMISSVSGLCKYQFSNYQLLVDAIQPIQYRQATEVIVTSSFQRLEFLGDAVIDLLVMEYLYAWQPNLSPGELSDWKSLTVSNQSLAAVSIRIGLSKWLRHSSRQLENEIARYSQFVSRIKGANDDQEEFAHHLLALNSHQTENLNGSNFDKPLNSGVSVVIAAPKLLSDMLEALVGAMYADANCVLTDEIRSFVFDNIIAVVLRPLLEKGGGYQWGPHRHPVSVVGEIKLAVGCSDHTAVFSTSEFDEKIIACTYRVHGQNLVTGFGSNKKTAEANAASLLISERNDWSCTECGRHDDLAVILQPCSVLHDDYDVYQVDGPQKYLRYLSNLCNCVTRRPSVAM